MPARHAGSLHDVACAVLLSHPAACALLQNVERLLAWAPPAQIHPSQIDPPPQGGAGWQAWLQRVALTLDFIYGVLQCLATSPSYVLVLQDDVIPTEQWDTGIERFVVRDLRDCTPWTVLSLSDSQTEGAEPGEAKKPRHMNEFLVPGCSSPQALLFNASELPALLKFVEEHIVEWPLELNVHKYLEASGMRGFVHGPSLFQHRDSSRSAGQGGDEAPQNTVGHEGGASSALHPNSGFQQWVVKRPYRSQRC